MHAPTNIQTHAFLRMRTENTTPLHIELLRNRQGHGHGMHRAHAQPSPQQQASLGLTSSFDTAGLIRECYLVAPLGLTVLPLLSPASSYLCILPLR